MRTNASRESCVLALDATPLVGGQGLNLYHWAQALSEFFDLKLFSRVGISGLDFQKVPYSPFAGLLKKIPLLRRRSDWLTLWESSYFDRFVKSSLANTSHFVGGVGQCALSLQRAKEIGASAILDVVNVHVDDLAESIQPEFERFGVTSFLHPDQRESIRLSYLAADKIRVMSDYARETFLKRGIDPRKVVTAAPPIEDMKKFTPAQFQNPKFRISCAGMLHPGKGFSYLIDAYEKLKLRDAELVFWGSAGNRALNQYFEEVTKRNPTISVNPIEIRVHGYDRVYASSHVLVHPSVSDGFGYVVAEAMASGIPVIVTEQTGAKMMVEDGKNGFIVPSRNPEAIAEKLELLYRQPALVRELGKNARLTAESYTLPKFQKSILSLFYEPQREKATL